MSLRLTYLLILLCACSLSAQTHNYPFQSEAPIANFTLNENDTLRYEGHYRFENAYQVIEDMLTDKRPLDFAESVFAVENCMYDGNLDHSAYKKELNRITNGVKQMVASGEITAPTHDVALNYAIYVFFTKPCPLNNYHPYEYDKMSLIEDVGLTGGMVTNLLKTGMGTCHSLPYLYKIIADKVGAKAYIALAPLHLYIRHQDAEGKWWNYETTTGTYSRSAWIMESFHVNEKAIRSGLYMTNLSDKETIVQSLYDLLCVYERKTGFYSNDFVRRCYTLGLKYHYADNLHSRRIGDLEYQMKKKAWNKGFRSIAELRNDPVLGREYDYIQQQIKAYEEMGFYAYTQEEYMQKYQEALNYNRTTHTDDIRKWLSVDPLADKYPNISPYAYCGWNPVKYVDPDGREKNVFLHPLMDETLRKGANNYKDNVPSIHIWAHGSSNSIQFYNEATDETIMANSAEKVLNFLNEFVFPESDAWQKHLTEGTQAVIVLHACETGKGENSIAQQLSAQLPNTIVIAPNENVAVDKTTNKELGTYKTRTVTNEKGENVLTTDGVGAWTIFREGNPIVSFDGSTKPNASKPENFHIEGL